MLFGIFKTFSGSKVQLVEFLYETADTFPLYFIQLSGTTQFFLYLVFAYEANALLTFKLISG